MHTLTRPGWFICLLALVLSGCGSLHVDVGPTVDWDKISQVALEQPDQDPWQLAGAIRTHLQRMGLTVLAEDAADPDLRVRYFYQEGPDLNADGEVLTRLTSFHLQFIDPTTDNFVAVADYFYADSDSQPLAGVANAFAGLQQNMSVGGTSQAKPEPTPALGSEAEPAVAAPSPPQRQVTTGSEDKTLPEIQDSSPEALPQPTGKSAGAAPAAEQPPETLAPTTDRANARKIKPQVKSPWVPRFESWGFENWGEQQHDDGY